MNTAPAILRSPNSMDYASSTDARPQCTKDEQAYYTLGLIPRVDYKYKADKVVFWNKVFSKGRKVQYRTRTSHQRMNYRSTSE